MTESFKRYRIHILLFLIIIVGGFFRFWQVSNNPPSLYWDEVSQGYNAYSILKTGRDEHREFLPLARFVAYGDYKAPVYIYLDVPFIALFGETELAVRFPSALFGTLTVLLTFFLIRELFYQDKRRDIFALLGAFLLAISPWHIQLSRAAYEGNIATFFTILGVFLFFLAKRRNSWLYIFCGVSFVIGIYAFNAFRVFIPLLDISLFALYYKNIWKHKTQIIITASICLVLLIPFIQFLRTPESKLRFNEVNIFSDTSVVAHANKNIADEGNTVLAKVIHNRRVAFSYLYLKHYFDFFNPDFLFIHGDVNPRFSLQDNGELYFWELPLILAGIYFLFTKKSKETVFLLVWLLLAPVAGATARETPHALRGETFIPVYEIFSALGIVLFFELLSRLSKRITKAVVWTGVIIVTGSVFLFSYNYFIDYPYLYSEVWQDGYKAAVTKTDEVASQYDKIIFTDHYGRAYMYVSFYSHITPQEFWQNIVEKKDQFGLYNVSQMGKYFFSENIDSVLPKKGEKVLYVVSPSELRPEMKVFDTVYLRNGHPGFVFAKK